MTHHLLLIVGAEAVGEQGEHYDPLFTYETAASSSAHSEESGGGAANVDLSGAGTSKANPVASSSIDWSAGDSAGESGPAIRVESGKNFPMGPLETDMADEVTSAFGMTYDLLASSVYHISLLTLILLQGLR